MVAPYSHNFTFCAPLGSFEKGTEANLSRVLGQWISEEEQVSFPMGGGGSDVRVRVKRCCAAVSVTGVKPPPVALARAAKFHRFLASTF